VFGLANTGGIVHPNQMTPKSNMDAFGAVSLILFAALLAFNQVVIKVSNDGFQPIFLAGIRSAGAVVCIWVWMAFRGIKRDFTTARGAGLLIGAVFAAEFMLMFTALDLTSVARSSVIFYSMPLWLALAAHFLMGERLFLRKSIGLGLAFLGVAIALLSKGDGGASTLIGDLCALVAAILWACVALIARTSGLRNVGPEMQLMWQVAVSAPILLLAAMFAGPIIREIEPIHIWALGFQIVVVVSAGFMFWFWLLSLYPASSVASFSFLSPVLGVVFGWALLDEAIGWPLIVALILVAVGIVLINKPRKT
jgi:drug/metabolite transporter (DMT)-like permease